MPAKELAQVVKPLVQRARDYAATVLINSFVQVAKETAADGVHLPANAGSVKDIRAEFDTPAIIGCSTHSYKEAFARQRQGVDFITYSPIFPVSNKPGYGPPVGTDRLKAVVSRVNIPVLALGGVTPKRVENCLDAGAVGVAVMSTLMQAPEKAEEYLKHLDA